MGAMQQMLLAGGGPLDTQSVTTGSGAGASPNRQRGFRVSPAYGSASTGNSRIYGGAAILGIYWDENGGAGAEIVVFTVTGIFADSGWSKMLVGATNFNRSAAISFVASGGQTQWQFSAAAFASQPFSGTVAVVFT